MRSGQDVHTAAFECGRRKGQPYGDQVARIETPITQILMPRDEGFAFRLFNPEEGVPAQDIGTNQILDRIEYRGMSHQVVYPFE